MGGGGREGEGQREGERGREEKWREGEGLAFKEEHMNSRGDCEGFSVLLHTTVGTRFKVALDGSGEDWSRDWGLVDLCWRTHPPFLFLLFLCLLL